jgi:hypothetical protein
MDKTNREFLDKIIDMTGKSEEDIRSLVKESSLDKHSAVRSFIMKALDLTYGYANTLTLILKEADGASLAEGKSMETLLEEIYSGKKVQFRPLHDKIMERLQSYGDFEIAPKKGYLSLRAKKQFAMIGPKTNTRMEVGINLKEVEGDEVLIAQKKGSMCKYVVKITNEEDITEDLFSWLKQAYEEAK